MTEAPKEFMPEFYWRVGSTYAGAGVFIDGADIRIASLPGNGMTLGYYSPDRAPYRDKELRQVMWDHRDWDGMSCPIHEHGPPIPDGIGLVL